MSEKVSYEDFEKFARATAEALAIIAGLLAEAAGSGKLACHFAAALDANRERLGANPIRDKLLNDAYRQVLTKAVHQHPDDEVIQDLYASEFGSRLKH